MAQIWDSETSTWKHRNKARACFVNMAKSYSGDFLEIGPGYGRVMKELETKKSITGLEMDEELIKLLINRKLNVVKGIAEDMPFEKESFDVLLCEEVIEHIVNQTRVINEVYRVLRKNGIAIFTTPNKYIYRTLMFLNNLRKWDFQGGLMKNPTPGHVNELTGKQLKRLFEKDFEIIKFLPLNSYMPGYLLNKLQFLSINNLIVAKKK